ncbi:hypothetical protein ACFQZ4_27950 [Catellatospora coxensis]
MSPPSGSSPARPRPRRTPPSRPVRSGTLVAPPPPGLVALPVDVDAPWRRPDEAPKPPRAATPDPTPQATTPPDAVAHATPQDAPDAVAPAMLPDAPSPGTTSQDVASPGTAAQDAAAPMVRTPDQADVPDTAPAADGPAEQPVRAASPRQVESAPAVPHPDPAVPAELTRHAAPAGAVEPAHAVETRATESAHAPEPAERAHPAWLGEPTGRFDLDLPEHGRTNPSWLGEPTRRPDPDVPFDQYALPDDPPPAAFGRGVDAAPARPVTGPARAARDAVTIDLAEDDWHADLPDPVGGSASGSPTPAIPAPPGAHRPVAAGAAQPPAAGYSAPTEAFTMPVQEVPRESWIDPRLRGGRRARPEDAPKRKRARPPRAPRRTAVAMPLLILFALVAAFFSWVSAEPLWLAMGHGKTGTLTVTSCAGSGLLQRCVGEFATPARDFTAVPVDVFGPPGQAEGLSAPARIVGANSHRAYVTNGTGGLHLRWIVGLSIVLLCSIAIVFATGALRLPERRERLAAAGLAFAGPFLITIGFLAATF